MTSVACPITDHRHTRTPVAAHSVLTRSEHIEPAVLAPAVVAVARAISRAPSAAPGAAGKRPAQLSPGQPAAESLTRAAAVPAGVAVVVLAILAGRAAGA